MINIDITVDDQGIAVVRLASPEIANVLCPEDVAAIATSISQLQSPDSGARALILTGSGHRFSAGANLDVLGKQDGSKLEDVLASLISPLVDSLQNGRLPSIAALNGPAVGGAVGIALLCDIVLAADSAKLIVPFSRLGLVPDTGLTYGLPRLVGEARARAIAFLGGEVSAAQAVQWGLIYAAYPDAELMNAAENMARRLAAAPPGVYHTIRQTLIAARDNTMSEQIALECKLQASAVESEGFRKALAALRQPKGKS
jgi:2-(1,2-epoxy-1,2-dihydrophenyl)acetyl-CoA isomerase